MKLRGVELELFDHEAVCSVIRESGDFYEAWILDDLLRKRGPEPGWILDVGAHIGNHSVYWASFASPAGILAWEPMPESYALLKRNLKPYRHAHAIRLALSDRVGTAKMHRDEVNRGRSRISSMGTEWVKTIPLDEAGLSGVSLIKVDVEGWQRNVLLGASRTLHKCHPALLIEDGEQLVEPTLAELGLGRYQLTMRYPGSNDLWEWT